jgi:signal transduction histidine kinase
VRRIGAGVERILAPLRPQRARPQRLQIGELVRDSVSFVCRSGHEPRPRIVLEVAEALPQIFARVDDIHQIVVNLVANAFEATQAARRDAGWTHGGEPGPGPGPVIGVRLFDDPEAGRIVLEVEDDGPGIDPSEQTRVFEPFFTTKGSRGTGLGLPVVRDLVRELGGDLTIVSAPVIAGTRVCIGLPYALSKGPAIG